ncbi:MAG: transcriptional repressor [Bacteroidales bacterium]|jgi:Fur family ferric uptake transcriptional regulator|nr:transcriptional repressor [Bacteroidales bacterium]
MTAEEILARHNLKRTSCREGIIEVIMASDVALDENEIKEKLSGNYDRTTFYRSFKTLGEHDILHKIVIDNYIVKYALNNSPAPDRYHAHFYCNKCKTVQCLDSVNFMMPELPEGYTGEGMDVIIRGTCDSCTKKQEGK